MNTLKKKCGKHVDHKVWDEQQILLPPLNFNEMNHGLNQRVRDAVTKLGENILGLIHADASSI